MAEDVVVDARGLKCPLPVLKLEKVLASLGVGQRVIVWATDPVARIDIPLYCRQQGYALDIDAEGDEFRFVIVKSTA